MAGVSLIELLIALLIGSLLILGLVQVFGASRTAYQTSEGLARVQENARFALDYLQRDLRMAGHFGCVNDQAHFIVGEGDPVNRLGTATGPNQILDFSVSVQGYEATGTAPGDDVTLRAGAATWVPALPAEIEGLNPELTAGSDIIVLRFFGARGTQVNGVTSAGVVTIPVATGATTDGWEVLTDEGVGAPTMFGIADCSFADVFPGSGGTGSVIATGSGATALADRYTPSPQGQTSLYRANVLVYYVAPGASGLPSLYRARANSGGTFDPGHIEELVEGVESLQLIYGLDETPDISQDSPPLGSISDYVTAATLGEDAAQWRRVGVVRAGLVVGSPSPAAVQTADALDVMGVSFHPPSANDTHYRAGYQATVAVRNRLFGN
ncbi:PilW family protein [Luteimonas abyssi]|uniref:PilW family protein n=1 Tax=Luteimonas abyssi TaxID=1247514 RepID=UPI000AAD9DD6|nr:PilW family protein [Luteimonas abyssi]